jgi:hypothetical protein
MQAIIEMTGVSRNTLRKYQARFDRSDIGIDQLLNLTEEQLHDLFLRSPEPQANCPAPSAWVLHINSPMVEYTSTVTSIKRNVPGLMAEVPGLNVACGIC